MLALVAVAGCHRQRELRTVAAADGSATAHFVGRAPAADKGEPPPPLEFGVTSLWFSFAGDARRHPFVPTGALYFTDWSFELFSPDGRYVALLESHYGPIDVVATARLRAFLDGDKVPFERVTAPAAPGSTAPVIEHVRWVGPRELEFHASCCGGSDVIRRRIGDPGGDHSPQ